MADEVCSGCGKNPCENTEPIQRAILEIWKTTPGQCGGNQIFAMLTCGLALLAQSSSMPPPKAFELLMQIFGAQFGVKVHQLHVDDDDDENEEATKH